MTKRCSVCGEVKELSEFSIHSGERLRTDCKPCRAKKQLRYYRGAGRAVSLQWNELNADLRAEYNKKWAEENREPRREYMKQWAEENREHRQDYMRAWTDLNRDSVNERTMRRQATKKNATPAWADRAKTTRIYEIARILREDTGIDYQVDHIIPLTSDVVCGLHWHGNLQLLTKEQNIRKLNRLGGYQ